MPKVVYNDPEWFERNRPQRPKGRPKDFATASEFYTKFNDYIENIIENDYYEPPSYAGMARYMKRKSSTIYKFVREHPEVKSGIAEMIADVISSGAMMGKYKESSSIFTMKNRCGWTDKRETTNVSGEKQLATEKEAKAAILNLVERRGLKVGNE